METTSIFIGTSESCSGKMAQVWSEKFLKRMEPTSRKRPTVILQPKPTFLFVWSLLQTLYEVVSNLLFEKYLVLSRQNWCSYVGIKEEHHKTNPLNVAELHLGPPYNYILVWQAKTLNSKSTKNTSHESTKNTSHLSLSGNIKEGQWTILGSHRGLKCTKSEEF